MQIFSQVKHIKQLMQNNAQTVAVLSCMALFPGCMYYKIAINKNVMEAFGCRRIIHQAN